MEDKIHFTSLKESRDHYFVAYAPPSGDNPFATLQLTFLEEPSLQDAIEAMEKEGLAWFARFPIPILATAFGPTGDFVALDSIKPESHLMVNKSAIDGAAEVHWRLLKNDEMSWADLSRERLLEMYAGVPFTTRSEVSAELARMAQKRKVGWWIVFLWAAVAPAAFLIVEYFGPQWLAALVLLYGLFKSAEKGLKMAGRWEKSPRELTKEKEAARMKHHHYHCERNPDGFMRLKLENFEKDERDAIRAQADALRTDGSRDR